jgi:AraC-like DNA-binding protein/ligand-binding sensor protein
MKQESMEYSPEKVFRHPLLERLSDMALQLAGIRFVIVFPRNDGWGQIAPGEKVELPKFCRLIQSTADGVQRCRMCHVLMTIAACNKGLTDQRCHAGAQVLVTPISADEKESFAVLSTCRFRSGSERDTWEEVRIRCKHLDLNLSDLKKTCYELPELKAEQLETARTIFAAAADAAKEIRARSLAEIKLRSIEGSAGPNPNLEADVEREFRESLSRTGSAQEVGSEDAVDSKIPALIKVASDLVNRKPNMPFAVAEIAAAARMTPNHFSALFRSYTGRSFSTYLTEKRIEMAKGLLSDLTLNIAEIGRMVGYNDPSYFTRRFKQVTGMTPGEYRNSLSPV